MPSRSRFAGDYGFTRLGAVREWTQTYVQKHCVHSRVLISLDSQLRRHRRQVLTALAVFAVALAVPTAHAAVMNGGMDDHAIGDAAAICLAVGGSLAIIGVATVALRRLRQRPLWLIPAAPTSARLFVGTPDVLARAGPRPLLQVFQL